MIKVFLSMIIKESSNDNIIYIRRNIRIQIVQCWDNTYDLVKLQSGNLFATTKRIIAGHFLAKELLNPLKVLFKLLRGSDLHWTFFKNSYKVWMSNIIDFLFSALYRERHSNLWKNHWPMKESLIFWVLKAVKRGNGSERKRSHWILHHT